MKKRRSKGKNCRRTYYRLVLNGGEARKAFTLPWKVTALKPVDGETMAALVLKDLNELPAEGLEGKALDKVLAQREEEKDYEVLDERRIGLTAAASSIKKEPGRCW